MIPKVPFQIFIFIYIYNAAAKSKAAFTLHPLIFDLHLTSLCRFLVRLERSVDEDHPSQPGDRQAGAPQQIPSHRWCR